MIIIESRHDDFVSFNAATVEGVRELMALTRLTLWHSGRGLFVFAIHQDFLGVSCCFVIIQDDGEDLSRHTIRSFVVLEGERNLIDIIVLEKTLIKVYHAAGSTIEDVFG